MTDDSISGVNSLLRPRSHMVGRRGLEPRTYGLKVRSSTIELATQGGKHVSSGSPFIRKPIRSSQLRYSDSGLGLTISLATDSVDQVRWIDRVGFATASPELEMQMDRAR